MNVAQRIQSAAARGDLDQVKLLGDEDPNLIHATDGESPYPTPLHQAAAHGHAEVVRWLLGHGADARWRWPQTPLHVAWQRANNLDVIRLLVAHGGAHSEMFAAVYLNDLDQVAALARADPTLVHERDDIGMTPLHRAAENGQAEMVKVLIALGADVEALSDDGQTPLQRSYYRANILEVLLAHGASMDIVTAINVDRIDHVARLLDDDPSLVHTRVRDLTPLQFAARRERGELLQLLLDRGAKVNVHDGWKGWTPLHWAAHDGRAENVRLLLANGADVHARDDDGKTPGDIAVDRGHTEMAALLQSRSAST